MNSPSLRMAVFFLLIGLLTVSTRAFAQERRSVDIEALIGQMTLEEKVGEMTQLTLEAVSSQMADGTNPHILDMEKLREAVLEYHVGSFLNVWDVAFAPAYWAELIRTIQDMARERRTGIPVIYGIDAVHGHHYMEGATVFPQNLALAATWDPDLVRQSNIITAAETRASGIPWNFSPVLDVGRQPLWSRFFETFGEDVHLINVMSRTAVEGLQQSGRLAATAKHFLGYGVPLSGKDRTPAYIPERQLREYHLPMFRHAIEAGVKTIMVNSGDIDGIPVHANHYLLTTVLRDELGFEGFVVTDWLDVVKLHTFHRVASSEREATRIAVEAGIDMSMVPHNFDFHRHLVSLVRDGEIPESRIDQSVRRILQVKWDLGLFDDPYADLEALADAGSPESQAVSRRAAEQAIVLTENREGFLPMARSQRILLTGAGADNVVAMHGSWTYTWQGTNEAMYPDHIKTIIDAVRDVAGSENVSYVTGTTYAEELDIAAAAAAAAQADVAIVVLAELPSTEQEGDIDDLALPAAQRRLAEAVMATGTPTVLVLVQNRPQLIAELVPDARAVLLTHQSGPFTGEALADILFGDINPSGRLPYTYPRYAHALGTYDHPYGAAQGPRGFNPQWTFGHGLSYTSFAYSALTLGAPVVHADDDLVVQVTVTNTGERAGKEVVQLYVRQMYASITPPVRRLRGFEKITLEAGESRTVHFRVPVSELAFVGRDNEWTLEPGAFEVYVGDLEAGFELVVR
jgi:beta-glucosidase